MAQVIPFPLCRRIDLIRKQAEFYARSGHRAAENQLTYLLARQRETLLRKGLDAKMADDQVDALENAIRAYVSRLERTGGHG